ncbi:hypothetical protein FACS1894151_03640 [Spirochaetia bacterium]|nr:hypothetical protein FACS1894151_03640 [Spirochaetia bacterium]
MTIEEILSELLRQEYPSLLPGHDPDIERYFYLRNSGYAREAMHLYTAKIKLHYPDEEFRGWLLRCYRSRDPSFRLLLERGYRDLALRSLERIKRLINHIGALIAQYNAKDIYSTLKTAENILSFFPRDHYEAISGIERLARYAEGLQLKTAPLVRAAELIRSYMNESLTVVEDEMRRRREIKLQQMEQERQKLVQADFANYIHQKNQPKIILPAPKPEKPKVQRQVIDLSTVTFSPADLERIEIPANISRIEDRTLLYCVKYWNLITDFAFERTLYLYSRKYGKKNYDIFMMIRHGRQGNRRDEEILASVMSTLVNGYYYSIQGDRYLQRSWTIIKKSLPPVKPKAAEKPKDTAKTKTAAKPRKTVKTKPAKAKPQITAKLQPDAKVKPDPATKKTVVVPAPPAAKQPEKIPTPTPVEISRPPISILPSATTPAAQAKTPSNTAPLAPPLPPPDMEKANGSVSDRLKELSGRSYDVYQDRFLARARTAIRKVLGAGRGIFFTLPEKAEDLVFNFLKKHYSDPYMNWETSDEKKELQAMGFELLSLDPVIDECYKSL